MTQSLAPRLILDTPELLLGDVAADPSNGASPSDILTSHPNPFNPEATLKIQLETDAHVTLCIYDVQGRLVADLVDRNLAAGWHTIRWNGRDTSGMQVGSGVYYARIEVGNAHYSHKLIAIK